VKGKLKISNCHYKKTFEDNFNCEYIQVNYHHISKSELKRAVAFDMKHFVVCTSTAVELSPIKLLPPDLKGGKSLMQSLQ
jgi:hypothetical protein